MNQKLKKVMILSGTYIVLMTVLLIGVSTARYTESVVAYSSFGTAGYNVLLLGRDPETGAYSETGGDIENFGKTLLSGDYIPGMKYTGNSDTNTAKVFPFQVANGTTEEDVSDVSLDYTVSLRTTRNLPLSFKLLLGTTVYNANDPKPVDRDGNVVTEGTAQLDESGIAWYEWTFRDIGNTEDGTGEIETSPVFSLSGGTVDSNTHAIAVEWPVTVDSTTGLATGNEQEYMKEIELLEVRVTSASRSHTTLTTDSEDYSFTARDYSRGFIVLDPEQDVQTYEVDYRAFQLEASHSVYCTENTWQYDFVVDNGISIGKTQTESETGYKVSVLAPMLWQGEDSGGSESYQYYLWKEERTAEKPYGTGNLLPRRPLDEQILKYDVKTGQYDNAALQPETTEGAEELIAASAEDSGYRYYRRLDFAECEPGDTDQVVSNSYRREEYAEAVYVLENTEETGGVTTPAARYDTFHLEFNNNSSAIPAYLQLGGKLKIVIEKTD